MYEDLLNKGYTHEQAIKKMEERITWLECLESVGVDNWDGYNYAFELMEGVE